MVKARSAPNRSSTGRARCEDSMSSAKWLTRRNLAGTQDDGEQSHRIQRTTNGRYRTLSEGIGSLSERIGGTIRMDSSATEPAPQGRLSPARHGAGGGVLGKAQN